MHLSDIGYTLFANEYIKAINAGYGTHIPLSNISQFLQNNDPALQRTNGGFVISPEVAKQMLEIFNTVPLPTPPRGRASRH